MKIDKKELMAKLPPCHKCGLCTNPFYNVKRGEWECTEAIERTARENAERDQQRLWALSDLWNLAFDSYCDYDEEDKHDFTVYRMMRAEKMADYVKQAKAILRMTDVKKIKAMRQELSDRYHGKSST